MDIRFSDLLIQPRHKAIALLEDEYKRTGDVPTLRNSNLLLLDIGAWKSAKCNCERIIEESEHTHDKDLIEMGMVDWFTGNISSAIDSWRKAIRAEYTDAIGAIDGPLILWYGGARLGDDRLMRQSLKKLERFWKVKDYHVFSEWPGTSAIAAFLLDKVPEPVFLNKWKWENLENRRLCRAHFWVGMRRLDKSKDEAIRHFHAAFSRNKIAILEYEYFLAKWEYSRLTGEDWNTLGSQPNQV